MSELRNVIERIVEQEQKLQTIVGTVTDVDKDKATCTVAPVNGQATFFNVRLRSIVEDTTGIVIYPKKDSLVLITLIENNENAAFISEYSEIDSALVTIKDKFKAELKDDGTLELNDAGLGGLTITPELKVQLDKTNQLLSAIIGVLNSTPIPEPGNGSASALQAALSSAIAGKQLGSYEDIEDEKIKH